MILVHGRGASARNILGLAHAFDAPDLAFLAPDAAGGTWYPYSFLMPREQNEPYLSSALRRLGSLVEEVEKAGIPPERLILLGFSQGACLSLDFAARNPRRYGAVVGLSGGLIGAEVEAGMYGGSLEGTPVFLGSSDPDPHVPAARVQETDRILAGLDARVTTRIYPGMGHTIIEDELEQVRRLIDEVRGETGE
jgi:predicted esterase